MLRESFSMFGICVGFILVHYVSMPGGDHLRSNSFDEALQNVRRVHNDVTRYASSDSEDV
jgi:hypothetical protein